MIALRLTLIILVIAYLNACSGGTHYEFIPGDIDNPNNTGNNGNDPNTTALSAPQITEPSTAIHASNKNELLVKGSCVSGNIVQAFEEVESDFEERDFTICSNGEFELMLKANADGNYLYEIYQAEPGYEVISTPSALVWQRDTVVPSEPKMVSPMTVISVSGGNLKFTGECEEGGKVEIAGDFKTLVSCINRSFESLTSIPSDGLYNFQIRQFDRAGNSSRWKNLYWLRNSLTLEAPSIEAPTQQLMRTTDEAVQIAGTCISGAQVEIERLTEPSFLWTVPCIAGAYKLTDNIEVGETQDYAIRQTKNLQTSAEDWVRWTRLESEPIFNIIRSPDSENLRSYALIVLDSLAPNLDLDVLLDGSSFEYQDGLILIKNPQEGLNQLILRSKTNSERGGIFEEIIQWLQAPRSLLSLCENPDFSTITPCFQ